MPTRTLLLSSEVLVSLLGRSLRHRLKTVRLASLKRDLRIDFEGGPETSPYHTSHLNFDDCRHCLPVRGGKRVEMPVQVCKKLLFLFFFLPRGVMHGLLATSPQFSQRPIRVKQANGFVFLFFLKCILGEL